MSRPPSGNLPIEEFTPTLQLEDEKVTTTAEVLEGPLIIIDKFERGDTSDPQQFSLKRKLYHTLVLTMLNFTSSVSSSIMSPAPASTLSKNPISSEVGHLTSALVLLGYSLGPLIWTPFNEAYGKKKAWTVATLGFILFQIPTGINPNLTTLFLGRFFQGIFGVCAIVSLGGTMSDIWDFRARGYTSATNIIAIYAAPTLGPIIGAVLIDRVDFGWLSWLIMIIGGVLFIMHFFVKESYAPLILRDKAIALRKQGINARAPIEEAPPTLKNVLNLYVLRPLHMLRQDKALLFLCVYSSISYGLLYAFFVAYPRVYSQYRHYGFIQTYLPNFEIMIGVFFCSILLCGSNPRYLRKCDEAGENLPEERLENMSIGAVGLPIGLMMFGWTGPFNSIHWMVPAIASVITGFSTATIFMTTVMYTLDVYKQYGVSALAANGVMRSLVAVLLVMVIDLMIDRMTFQGTFSFLAGIGLLVAPGPFILRVKGRAWRETSVWGKL
ncbi:Tpo1p [Sugiyamaella lignohabitans]|uniref:Tpo1p n=1 Tax=Sugiyamaella lignohabitans TaxID=796027 RepID=A0A167FMQ4_9ASCO|nr:Tpo1p [Sugiyamaella lignohabitans]ANB15488.1 Tpo1p [Sugiyamaella lignohabitans]